MAMRCVVSVAALVGAIGASTAAMGQVSFTQIPQLPGGTGGNSAAGVSADGRYVVGNSDSSNSATALLEDGFRYDRSNGGLVSLGSLNAAGFSTHASGVSGNGATVAGFSKQLVATTNTQRAFSWTSGGGMVGLGVESGTGASFAYGVSLDGSTIVGSTTTSGSAVARGFKYAGGTFTLLPGLSGGGATSGRSVSADGSVVVGDSGGRPFRNDAGGTAAIPAIAGAPDGFGEALGVSADGTTAVGAITSPTLTDNSLGFPISQGVAFRWKGGVTREVGALPSTGTQTSEAFAVSGNGLVVVGQSRTAGTLASGSVMEAFVWTPRDGIARLATKLGSAVPAGVRLDNATGVSADGSVIVGTGTTLATGTQVAFVATLPYCVGDQNENGSLQVQDIFDFLTDWFAGNPRADANGSGGLEVQDIFDFLGAWFGGC